MNKIIFFLFSFVLLNCEENLINLNNYSLIWSDNFEEIELDKTKWSHRYVGKRKLGYTKKESIQIYDNSLKIIMYKDNNKYCAGMISTENKFEVKYGYFEIKAKVPYIKGPQVAFWLQSSLFGHGVNNIEKYGVEIDIMEYVYKNKEFIHFTTHWDGYKDYAKKEHYKVKYPSILDEKWHTFGLVWEENSYSFYIDRILQYKTYKSISKKKQYLIISAEYTEWGAKVNDKKLPAIFEIDYVRVYKKNKKDHNE